MAAVPTCVLTMWVVTRVVDVLLAMLSMTVPTVKVCIQISVYMSLHKCNHL